MTVCCHHHKGVAHLDPARAECLVPDFGNPIPDQVHYLFQYRGSSSDFRLEWRPIANSEEGRSLT